MASKPYGILERTGTDTGTYDIHQKARAIYNTCINFAENEERPDGIVNVLNSHGLQHWPILEDDVINASLENNRTAMFLKIGIQGAFDLTLQRDPQNSTTHVIQVRKPVGTASEEENKKAVIQRIALLIRPDANITSIAKFVETVSGYGKRLKYLKKGTQIYRAAIGELQRNFSRIPLLNLLNNEFQKVNTTLTEEDIVELHTVGFYSRLDEFIQDQQPRTMYNYAGVSVLSTFGEHISKTFRDAFLKAKHSPYVDRDRKEECVELIRSKMPEIIDYLYVLDTHDDAAMAEVQDIATRVKSSVEDMLMNNTWISNSATKSLIEKLNKTTVSVGYPVWLMNHTFLQDLYGDVPDIDRKSSFIELFANISNSHFKRQLRKLREPYNGRENWVGSASAVNAFYSQLDDKLEVPAALLQPPLYQPGLPRSLSYGAVGTIIARELSRAFARKVSEAMSKTSEGGREDISKTTELLHEEKAKCFVTQYSNITVGPPEIEGRGSLKGGPALEDNIADSVGLQSAYNAYMKLLEEDCGNTDTRLKGLKKLSGKKLFFIAKAMEMCKVWNSYELWRSIVFGSLIPPRYRVNVALTNLKAFGVNFNCSERWRITAKPYKPCQLW